MTNLQQKYEKEIKAILAKEFDIKNIMAVPKVNKVVINMGIGKDTKNKELKESLQKDLATISGQKPSIKLAKVSIASFNLRRGMPVGLAVTLRGDRMYDFLHRLFSIVLPRLRDFRGLPKKSLDKGGNFTLGLTEQIVFPEIDQAKSTPHGLEITIVTSTKDSKKAERLLELLGLPFERKE